MVSSELEARENSETKEKYGHCLSYILPTTGDHEVHWPSPSELYKQLCDGTSLNNGSKIYWFHRKGRGNAYFIFPKAISIAWINECQYWRWISIEIFGKKIDVAELVKVRWLDVRVRIKEYMLSAGVTYELLCHLLLKSCASGWHEPINFGLTLPNGTKFVNSESLECKPRDVWFTIKVEEFKIGDKHGCLNAKEYEFSMYNHNQHWKSGLIFKSFEIRPKQPCCKS